MRIHSALFQRGRDYFAMLTNTSDEERDVRLALAVDGTLVSARDLRTGGQAPVLGDHVTLSVPARSGTAVQLS
jgi:hypothetical protein